MTAARRLAIGLSAVVGFLAPTGPTSAGAASQIGQTFNPTTGACGPAIFLQSDSPNGEYAAPFAGVITSWSFQAGSPAPQLKFKVARPAGGNSLTVIAESPLKTAVANQLNTYTDIRIPVQAGDVIGFYLATSANCLRTAASTYRYQSTAADLAPGTTFDFGSPSSGFQLDVSATLELDCDKDGLGDETQDTNLLSCDTTPPNAQITKGPKDKTKKKTATFEFTGSDLATASSRQVSGFQCKLDAGAFLPCTSPYTVRVKKGKHTFQVQAIDQAGNVGAVATDTWKRKRKKK